jgi:hypothetical protein
MRLLKRMPKIWLALPLWFAFFGWAHADAAPGGFVVGVGIHRVLDFRWQSKTLPSVREAGVTSVRTDVKWADIEKQAGVYVIPPELDEFVDLAARLSIQPVLILDYGNKLYDNGNKPLSAAAVAAYVRYVKAITGHFGARIRYYEIWNEWDNAIGGTAAGTAADYAKLVMATYPAIKAINRNSIVLVGAATERGLTNGWYEQLARLGALKTADGISVHPYSYRLSPTDGPELSMQWIDALHATLDAQYGIQLPIYVTEIGWPTNDGKWGYSEKAAGDFLQRTVLMAASRPYVRGVWWYDFIDDGPNHADREENFGLLHPSLEPKAAWNNMKVVTKSLAERAGQSAPAPLQSGGLRTSP